MTFSNCALSCSGTHLGALPEAFTYNIFPRKSVRFVAHLVVAGIMDLETLAQRDHLPQASGGPLGRLWRWPARGRGCGAEGDRRRQLGVSVSLAHANETPERTAALGGHVEACEDCGHQRIAYNSCLMGKFRSRRPFAWPGSRPTSLAPASPEAAGHMSRAGNWAPHHKLDSPRRLGCPARTFALYDRDLLLWHGRQNCRFCHSS